MARVFIVYDTKYGNTKVVAEKIAEGMGELKGMETEVSDVKKVDLKEIESFDAILIGAPTHFGGPSRTIMKFIDKLSGLKLKAKGVAVFDTFLGEDFEKGVKRMEKRHHPSANISDSPDLSTVLFHRKVHCIHIHLPAVDGEPAHTAGLHVELSALRCSFNRYRRVVKCLWVLDIAALPCPGQNPHTFKSVSIG